MTTTTKPKAPKLTDVSKGKPKAPELTDVSKGKPMTKADTPTTEQLPFTTVAEASDPPDAGAVQLKPTAESVPITPVDTPTGVALQVDPMLVKILSWVRPHGSDPELAFCNWVRATIEKAGFQPSIRAGGCITVTIPRKDGKTSNVLFSCHVDTVHSSPGDGKQGIVYDPTFEHIFLNKLGVNVQGSCLGADDGAGVWLLLKMIRNEKPGTYIFHRGEERGGIGANAMLSSCKDWLGQFDLAVAFDRADNFEIITHQGGQRCASDKFGNALIEQLANHGRKYELSTRGTFTDTKVYRKIIPECINVGVGYKFQHGPDEYLDYRHLTTLLDAVLDVDWDALPVDRDPTKDDTPSYGGVGRYIHQGGYGGYGLDDADRWEGWERSRAKSETGGPAPTSGPKVTPKAEPKASAPIVPGSIHAVNAAEYFSTLRIEEIRVEVEQDPDFAAACIAQLLADRVADRARLDYIQSTLLGDLM